MHERRERASDAKAPFVWQMTFPHPKLSQLLTPTAEQTQLNPLLKDLLDWQLKEARPAIKPTPTTVSSVVEPADSEHSFDNSLFALVPDNATAVGTIDMNSPFLPSIVSMSGVNAPESELAFHLKVFEELFDIDTIAFATLDNEDLFIIPGTFDGLEYMLESERYTRQTYLGFELWEGHGAELGESVVIVNGHTISGTPEVVREVLDRVTSGSGLMAQERESDIMRVMNRIDKEMFVFASVEDCDIDNCEAVGMAISMEEGSSTVDMKFVMLFRNERTAQSALHEAERESYLDDELLYIDVERDGETIIVDAVLEGETFWRGFMDGIQEGISPELFPGTDA